jgi:response regulator NasT
LILRKCAKNDPQLCDGGDLSAQQRRHAAVQGFVTTLIFNIPQSSLIWHAMCGAILAVKRHEHKSGAIVFDGPYPWKHPPFLAAATMSQSLRIVAADDDATMLLYYVRMIPHLGHRFLAGTSNGLELVEWALRSQPDLVISDICMPKLDGISAMERVQREADIPFIFVTADDQVDHHERLKRNRVLDYLQKPIRQADLSSAVEAASAAIFR